MSEALEKLKRIKASLAKPKASSDAINLLRSNIGKADQIIARLEQELKQIKDVEKLANILSQSSNDLASKQAFLRENASTRNQTLDQKLSKILKKVKEQPIQLRVTQPQSFISQEQPKANEDLNG